MISGTCTSQWDWPVEGAIVRHVTGEGVLPRGVAFGGEVAFKGQVGIDFQWRNGSNAETLNSEVPCSQCLISIDRTSICSHIFEWCFSVDRSHLKNRSVIR
ncbi:hypothetical protein TNCV_1304121 [Trichonephila clavipes]|nr:hypothetical protein TNCV_1304121 [Trichonephila clavipes]